MVREGSVDLGQQDLKDKITSLNKVIKEFRMSLEGYVWSGKDDTYYYTNKPLCDSRIIDQLVALLTSFTNEINLITIKDYQTFIYQQLYFCREVNKILYTSPYSNVETYTQVFLIADDTFQNIGDVILGSKGIIKSMTSGDDPEEAKGLI